MTTKSNVAIGAGVVAAALGTLALLPETCPSTSICLSWQPSPGWTDGTPFAPDTVVEYVLFRYDPVKNTGIPLGSTRELSARFDNQPRGKQCYMVTAKALSPGTTVMVESEPTKHENACKMIRMPAPTDGAIEAPTDGAIESP